MNKSSNPEEQFKSMKPKSLSREERQVLWLKISSNLGKRPGPKSFWPFASWRILPRGAAVAIAVLVVLVGSSLVTAAAAEGAKPGDPLFGVDLAIEKVRLALALKTEAKDELRVRFATERLAEAQALVEVASETIVLAEASSTSSNEASSTDQGTTTSQAHATTTPSDERRIVQANLGLEVALEHLEANRARLEARGNETAVLALDIIIEELKNLAAEHSARLEKFTARIKENGNRVRIEIKAANNKLKTKFELELKAENDDDEEHEEKIEERLEERRERIETRVNELRQRVEKRRDRFDERLDKFLDRLEDQLGRGLEKVVICHRADGANRVTIRISKAALDAHLAHGDQLGQCDDNEEDTEEEDEEDNQPPVIDDLEVRHVASTTATIRWETNEPADSTVWYATTTPLVVTDATSRVTLTTLVETHEVDLSGLAASTTNYFTVGSTDGAGNTATSSESSFTTLGE